jgi:hypothetical protein
MGIAAHNSGGPRAAAADTGRDSRWLLLAAVLPVLHLLMFGYDLQHPERFLNGDRALTRIRVIQDFVQLLREGGDLSSYLAQHGIIGDWLPHALLYALGGQYVVIAVQVLLALLSLVWLSDLARRVGFSDGAARAIALVYGLTPHALVLPHQLVTEAIFIPLIIGSSASFARALNESGRGLVLSGFALGLATLVRPLTLLWPLVLVAFTRFSLRLRLAYLLGALGPLLLWMGFIFIATGEFSMGKSNHDLGHNLFERADMIAMRLPESERPVVRRPGGPRVMSLREYAGFVLQYPGAAIGHSAQDVIVFVFKSGTERILLDYLDPNPDRPLELSNWRAEVEQQGLRQSLTTLFSRHPGLTSLSVAGAGLLFVLMLLACAGAVFWLRDSRQDVNQRTQMSRLILIAFPLYILLSSQAVDASQARHRAPAEFALCLLAAAALTTLRRRISETRRPSVEKLTAP